MRMFAGRNTYQVISANPQRTARQNQF